jgi:hypothetical protein
VVTAASASRNVRSRIARQRLSDPRPQ